MRMRVEKTNKVTKFQQKTRLKPYFEMITERGYEAAKKFLENSCKITDNNLSGKLVEDVRNGKITVTARFGEKYVKLQSKIGYSIYNHYESKDVRRDPVIL